MNDSRTETVDWRELFKRYAQVVEYHEAITYLTPKDWSEAEWVEILAALEECHTTPDIPVGGSRD